LHKLFQMLAAFVAAVTATFSPGPDNARTTGEARPAVVAPPPAPSALVQDLQALGSQFDGRAGIAVRDIQTGWTAQYNGEQLFPQQSVSKLWVALATFEAIDKGEMRLDEQLLMRREDLSVFHQPIRAKVDHDGYVVSVEELLVGAIAKSDNAANDMLMRRVGGGVAVQEVIDAKKLGAIRAGTEERLLQAEIAGMSWRPEYSVGWSFQEARALLPDDYRKQRLDAYLSDPPDGATPSAIVEALARLKKGELLSLSSTARLLEIMRETETGSRRLRGGLPDGWAIGHKTGTGQELAPRVTGWNDVGIVTAPDGRSYAVAVMIAETSAPIGARMSLFQAVARTVVDHHAKAFPPPVKAQNTAGPEPAPVG
jgi:beta-lactamase class A